MQLAMLPIVAIAWACSPEPIVYPEPAAPLPPARFDTAEIEAMRAQKDSLFRSAESPIADSLRADFPGLRYFPPSHRFAFDLQLMRFAEPESVILGASNGEVRRMQRYGVIVVLIDNEPCTLTVFKPDAALPRLFIPFQDATSGVETYEVGRYLDLQERPDGELYRVDFNQAYHPWCAYNERFSCPLVPSENRLPVAIPAGERLDSTFAVH